MSDCERCAQLDELLRESQAQVAELAAVITGLEMQLRRAARAEAIARGQLERQADTNPKKTDIEEVLEHFHAQYPRRKVPLTGKRAEAVKRALGWGYTVDELKTALDGIFRFPFVGSKGRQDTAHGGAKRHDDLTVCLASEERIERFIAYMTAPSSRPEPARGKPVATTDPRDRPRAFRGDPVDRMLAALHDPRPAGEGKWTARCPAHDDRHASLSVARGDKGVLVTCHAGCTPEDIATALAMPIAEWFIDDPAGVPVTRWSNTGAPPTRTSAPTAPAIPADADPLPSEQQLEAQRRSLQNSPRLLTRLQELKGWQPDTLDRLRVGWDHAAKRLVFAVRDEHGQLLTTVRYQPGGKPKTLGLKHRDRGLFPAPESLTGEIWLVEGEPDAVTGHQLGLAAVAVPGVNGWRKTMVDRLKGRHVVICMDCDDPGRKAARDLLEQLLPVAQEVRVVDLDPARDDGYDLTDAHRDGITGEQLKAMAMQTAAIHDLRLIA